MADSKPQLEEITGFVGIGTLEILGIFFILDGRTGFLSFIETYSKTETWTLFVTVPLLVVAYLFGFLSSIGMDIVSQKLFKRPPSEVPKRVLLSGLSPLITKLADTDRHVQLLNGCSFAFLVIAVGCWSEIRMMGGYGSIGVVGIIGAVFLSAICVYMGQHVLARFDNYVDQIIPKPAETENDGSIFSSET